MKNILANRYFLFATEFFAGMSVMAVELGASRLMAPYFSSSQIVWTVIIGVIMIAMAIGNIWGGSFADKNPDPSALYARLLIAAIWIALIPFLGRYLIGGISLLLAAFVTKNFLVWAALFTCLAVFAFPCVLLGTVTPSLAKYTVSSLDNNGKIVGQLGALNTIGSIIGTFIPTFVIIPAVGTAATFVIFSAVLAIISILYFISAKKKAVLSVVSAAVIVAMAFASPTISFAFWEKDLAVEDESIYNYLQVKKDENSTVLSTNVLFGVQSIMMHKPGLTGMYYDYALAAPVMAGLSQNSGGDILILGLGTGTFAKYCDKYFSGVQIEGVEIDQKIADLALEYFELPEKVDVSVYDARAYLKESTKKYDVIMVDAYQDITIPFQMSSVEFFTQVKEHLKDSGVMVVNMNMKSSAKGSINDYLCDTIAAVFGNAYISQVESGTNCEVFAGSQADLIETFYQNKTDIKDLELDNAMRKVAKNIYKRENGQLILTDDKAPVEVLGMKVLDEIIGQELDYYRQRYLPWQKNEKA